MSLVLGIDTGGTYTDGVIIERAGKKILGKAKALTTRENLITGIRNCISALEFDKFEEISVVSLSTTLATNAIVEGHGCEVGLIMIGYELEQKTPAKEIRHIAGGHGVKGTEAEPLDLIAAREAILSMKGKVEAIAVSGYFSIRNPEHEQAVQKMVTELLDLPVVCAHHLTRSLGIYERTLTAVLNARLIPVIKELLASVKTAMAEKNISGSLMIVRGDGSLMSEEQAKDKPIETILSGPASSVMGAIFLAGEKDALVLDMGGTTTDIAVLKNGVPKIGETGAKVGGWSTMVEAAEIYTYGLGGDSYLRLNEDRILSVGPQRVWPVSVIAGKYPYYADELRGCLIAEDYKLLYAQATDGFIRLKNAETYDFSDEERRVWDILEGGPRTLSFLTDQLNVSPNFVNMNRLVSIGALARISLTPTDILTAAGEYDTWNAEAAKAGIDILARRMRVSREEFIEQAIDLIVSELCYTVWQSISEYEGNSFVLKESDVARYFIGKQLSPNALNMLACSLRPSVPIIGIGAPVAAWLPKMSEKLHARLIIPDHPEVANAVGSATGKIMETVKILIHTSADADGYALHSPWEMKTFETLEEATAYGMEAAKQKAEELAVNAGAKDFSLICDYRHTYVKSGIVTDDINDDIYIDTKIEATAVERPEWERDEGEQNFFVDTRNRGMKLNR